MTRKQVCVFLVIGLLWMGGVAFAGSPYRLSSPDGRLSAEISVGEQLTWSLSLGGSPLMAEAPVSLTLSNGEQLGPEARVRNAKQQSVNEVIASPFWISSQVQNRFNELQLAFSGNWGITFRLYNDGMAYRFFTDRKEPLIITAEEAVFRFTGNQKVWVPYVKNGLGGDQLQSSFENTYVHTPLSEVDPKTLIFLPILADVAEGKRVLITEANLESYPGMHLSYHPQAPNSLSGRFAQVPSAVDRENGREQMMVTARENYIAKTAGSRTFPWRVCVVAESDAALAANDMVYRLADPSRIDDRAWIKPGKVAWDWWNGINLYNVDFQAGINQDSYKYFIDFAANHKLEYIILDGGWSISHRDLMKVRPSLDLPALVEYGRQRGVGIILWASFQGFSRNMEEVCSHYAQMGVKGFKVDFFDRDDQSLVDFLYLAAETAARHKLLLDFHGVYKPTGLSRTWPNVLNFEGVFGLEQMKWSAESVDMVTYDVTLPFIRMVAGPMDYTQGAMRNASRGNYRPVNSEPMSQGTRCRQLALYVVFNSPLSMLCDSPSDYLREPESLGFISAIPTVWDQTVPLEGQVGSHITLARRSGNHWYLGGITGWEARDMALSLSFLPAGTYQLTLFRDGINAHRKGTDYRMETLTLSSTDTLRLHLAPGGGFAAKLQKL